MALSFTPDGYLVAAASYNKILIWRAEEGGLPKACWVGEKGRWMGGDGAVARVERTEEEMDERMEEEEEDEGRSQDHSLSWDADGGKLAFGLGSQVRCNLIPPVVSSLFCLFRSWPVSLLVIQKLTVWWV